MHYVTGIYDITESNALSKTIVYLVADFISYSSRFWIFTFQQIVMTISTVNTAFYVSVVQANFKADDLIC